MLQNQGSWEVRFVNSTAISLIAYNRDSRTMRIIFNSMSGYDYPHTSEQQFLRLANSESVGQSFQPLRSQRSQRLPDEAVSAFYGAACRAQMNTRVMLG